MKDKNYSPYASFGLGKIDAPKPKRKDSPKSTVIKGKGDLRVKVTK